MIPNNQPDVPEQDPTLPEENTELQLSQNPTLDPTPKNKTLLSRVLRPTIITKKQFDKNNALEGSEDTFGSFALEQSNAEEICFQKTGLTKQDSPDSVNTPLSMNNDESASTPSKPKEGDDLLAFSRRNSENKTPVADMSEGEFLLTRTSSLSSPMGKNNSFSHLEFEIGVTKVKFGRRPSKFASLKQEGNYEILEEEQISEQTDRVEMPPVIAEYPMILEQSHASKRASHQKITSRDFDAEKSADRKHYTNHRRTQTCEYEKTQLTLQPEGINNHDGSLENNEQPAQLNLDATEQQVDNVNMGQVNQHLEQAFREKSKVYLRRHITFFVALNLCTIACLFMEKDQIDYRSIFTIIYVYFFSLVVEYSIEITKWTLETEIWKKKETILDILFVICSFSSLLYLDLTLSQITTGSILAVVPLTMFNFIYFSATRASNNTQFGKVIMRFFLSSQSLLFTLRLDGIIGWSWLWIFVPLWLYLFLTCLYFTIYITSIILDMIANRTQPVRSDDIPVKIKVFGLVWCLIYYLFTGSTLIFLADFTDAHQPETKLYDVKVECYVNIGLNVLLCIYMILARKQIAEFNATFTAMTTLLTDDEASIDYQQNKKPKITLQVEKKDGYFEMLSSTYFRPFNPKLMARNKGNIKKIRKLLSSFKTLKANPRKQYLQGKEQVVGSMTDRLSVSRHIKNKLSVGINSTSRVRDEIGHRLSNMFGSKNHSRPKIGTLGNTDTECKTNLSADDIEHVKKLNAYSKIRISGEDELLCYLCYDHIPDAILMNCGHGGICYECATATMQVKNECVECRAPVVMIHKIDPNPKLPNVLKSIEYTKVMVEEEPSQKK